MQDDKKSNNKLYIPSNVKIRLEFFKGYGVKELISSICVLLTVLPISYIVFKLKNNYLIPVIIEFIAVSISVISLTKDDNNICMIDQLKYMFKYASMQKKYEYKYYDKWRN